MRYYIPDAALIGNGFIVESRADGINTDIPANVNSVYTSGYYVAGDGGGAEYKKVALEPAHAGKFQSLDGAWWEIFSLIIQPEMFGCITGKDELDAQAIINLAAINNAFSFCLDANKVLKFSPCIHRIKGGSLLFDIEEFKGYTIISASPNGGVDYPLTTIQDNNATVILQADDDIPIIKWSGYPTVIGGICAQYETFQTVLQTSAKAHVFRRISRYNIGTLKAIGANKSFSDDTTGTQYIFDGNIERLESWYCSNIDLDIADAGTNNVWDNIYINGGGTLDFVTAPVGQVNCLNLASLSGIHIGAISIDGCQISNYPLISNNCQGLIGNLRFEACIFTFNNGALLRYTGSYGGLLIAGIDVENCKFLIADLPSAYYIISGANTNGSITVDSLNIKDDCVITTPIFRPITASGMPVNSININTYVGTYALTTTWTETLAGPSRVGKLGNRTITVNWQHGKATSTSSWDYGSAAPTSGAETYALGSLRFNGVGTSGNDALAFKNILAGSPGTWVSIFGAPYAGGIEFTGDAAIALTSRVNKYCQYFNAPITVDRVVTLNTTGAQRGDMFKIVRAVGATGASNVDVGGLKNLAAGEWAEVIYTGGAWSLIGFGSL